MEPQPVPASTGLPSKKFQVEAPAPSRTTDQEVVFDLAEVGRSPAQVTR